MTLWAAYTRREFDAQEECEALGITCHVPRRVDLIRQGKRRRPDPVVRPVLPGYIFIETDAHGWHMIRQSKHIRTMMGVGPLDERNVRAFIAKTEADYIARMAQIEAGERVSEYNEGDVLQIIAGPFQGQLARFKRIAEGAMFPEVIAEAEIMGQSVTLRLDPLAAKKRVA
jgi:transcription antitermination factor NusG